MRLRPNKKDLEVTDLENLNLHLELADFKKLLTIDPPSGVNVNVLSTSYCECRRLHCLHTEHIVAILECIGQETANETDLSRLSSKWISMLD